MPFFSVLGERAIHDSIDHILNERVVIARMAASEIDGFLHHVFTELTDANRIADFDPADADLSVEANIMSHIQRELGPLASSILFLDSAGRVVLASPPGSYDPGADLSSLPFAQQSLTQSEFSISEPFFDPVSNRPVAAASVPVFMDGRLAGALIGLIDLNGEEVMAPLERGASLGNTGHATLVGPKGVSLAATIDIPLLTGVEHPDFYPKALAEGQPAISATQFALENIAGETYQETHIMAFAPLSTVPWGIAIGGDEEDTFAPVKRLRASLILLSIIALAGIWTVTMGGTRRLIKPIQQLTAAAQRIARGNLNTPLPVSGPGEIGVMAHALGQMQNQMLKNINDLSHWNETLENQVAQKTIAIQKQQALTQRLLQHNIAIQEQERKRLARELHDGIGQMLMAIELSLDRLSRRLPEGNEETEQYLEKSRILTEKTSADLRSIIGDLRPAVLDQLGLIPALRWMGKHTLQPSGILMEIEASDMPQRLPDEIETTLFQIAQEAMNNTARHSQASRFTMQLEYESDQIMMTLADDGDGFASAALSPDFNKNQGFGLAGMQERAILAGGEVDISSAPGHGVTIKVTLPANAAKDK